MKNVNLQVLPKFEDSWSYLYFEKGTIDQHQKSIGFHYLDRVVPTSDRDSVSSDAGARYFNHP